MSQNKVHPAQKDDETEEEFYARIMARVEQELNQESSKVPDRFNTMSRAPTLTDEHPVFRTTNHDYGQVPVTGYERPTEYHTVQRRFTEKQHLGMNYEHSGFNL